jgi:hypothetical protein
MATKKTTKKSTKKPKKTKEAQFHLTVCKDCKIQLVIRKEEATKCLVCESTNISSEPWK